jgi:thiosulfate reductase cytochrome b subunit
MASSARIPFHAAAVTPATRAPRHAAIVRVTHWLTVLCFLALLLSGVEILISHPRFYWGETGNSSSPALFTLPIPASRAGVPTGYGFVLPDQNGWSRALHFQAAWFVVFTGLVYGAYSLFSGHFRKEVLPARAGLSVGRISQEIANHLRFKPSASASVGSYNVLQRLSYTKVIFVLFPLMIWTGLAMSPGFTSIFPWTVEVFGGQQSARTIHFFVCVSLVIFLLIHVFMVYLSGFGSQSRGMTTGGRKTMEEQR